jgi:hypothetical protein
MFAGSKTIDAKVGTGAAVLRMQQISDFHRVAVIPFRSGGHPVRSVEAIPYQKRDYIRGFFFGGGTALLYTLYIRADGVSFGFFLFGGHVGIPDIVAPSRKGFFLDYHHRAGGYFVVEGKYV